jgi:hypothetical protein
MTPTHRPSSGFLPAAAKRCPYRPASREMSPCWPSRVPSVPELDLKRPSKGRCDPRPSEARAIERSCARSPSRRSYAVGVGPSSARAASEIVAYISDRPVVDSSRPRVPSESAPLPPSHPKTPASLPQARPRFQPGLMVTKTGGGS